MMELLLLFLPLLMAGDIIPDACSPIEIKCVGEGQSCAYDQINGYNGCQSQANSWKVCRVCGESDLTCHGGYCMRNIGSVGDPCTARSSTRVDSASSSNYPSNHLACRKGLSCVANICQEQSTDDIVREGYLKMRGRGEACTPETTCVSGLVCDISRKCSLPVCSGGGACSIVSTEPLCDAVPGCNWEGEKADFIFSDSNRYYKCSSHVQCHFGEYCLNNQCVPGVPYGQRLGAQCVGADSTGDAQCGIGMYCTEKNPFETNSNYNIFVCKWFGNPVANGANFANRPGDYSRIAGERCQYDSECGKNMICSSAGNGNSVCSEADTVYIGEGCEEDSECGRGLECVCPSFGDNAGGRMRCALKQAYNQHNEYMTLGAAGIDYMRCLSKNQCIPLNGDYEVTQCEETHCKSHVDNLEKMWLANSVRLGSVDPSKSVCANAQQADALIQQYDGLNLAAVSGGQRSVYLSWSWGGSAIIALCISFLFQ